MKKFLALTSVLVLSALTLSSYVSAASEGEQDDSQTFCSSVNDQKHKVSEESSTSGVGQSSSASSASTL